MAPGKVRRDERIGESQTEAIRRAGECLPIRCASHVRPISVFRTGAAAGLLLLAEGPWLAWLPFAFVVRNPELGLKPLPISFGRRRYRTGLVARCAVEDLAPVRWFEDIVRDIAVDPSG